VSRAAAEEVISTTKTQRHQVEFLCVLVTWW
jgi:hypothetical protein